MSSNTSPLAAPIESSSSSSSKIHEGTPEKILTRHMNQASPSTGKSSSNTTRHRTRPSQELAAHERLVSKDSRARRTIPRDPIDRLDDILGSYHHEGPFDATLASRQIPGRAPVEATRVGNALAMAATPQVYIDRALAAHEPLDGTSSHASGTTVSGQRFAYDEENVEGRDREPETDRLHGARHDDEDEDDDEDGLVAQYTRDENDKHVRYRTEAMEMTSGSSRGIVEYSADLDEEESVPTTNRGKSGLISGLKKRMSIKR